MKTVLSLCAVLFFLAPAKNELFDGKCHKLKGTCKSSCEKHEEIVAFCQKTLKCCRIIQPCELSADSSED
ncbi:PREDICTED: beta-defensin 106A-like [Chinchilla lanigera]|uniref:beta-defensin 106A-like n=1 Tax=Chinchilla lanigera TaxID=34839 RepID=UPI00038F009F|nr:PREDICTED: beta-defensin 106A-like [Chinchilla lanigera]